MSKWEANCKFSERVSSKLIVIYIMYFSQLILVPPPLNIQARTHVDNELYNIYLIWHALHKNYSACRVHVSYSDSNPSLSCHVENPLF